MKKFFLMVGQRFSSLVAKCISVKFIFAIIATFLVYEELIPSWAWLSIVFALFGIRYLEKMKIGG
jgi:hypothetical protein